MLLNLSNHPSLGWPENQRQAAISQYGSIQDIAFPPINPALTEDDLDQLADEYEIRIRQSAPTAVHIMGEMTFTYRLVNRLKAIGIPCIASTTERIATEDVNGLKISTFKFVCFREY